MAILHEQSSQLSFYLGSLHLFGRNSSRCDTVLTNGDASQAHASIRWNGVFWEMLDQSRYGTLIDGQAIAPHTKTALAVGQTIHFAKGATQKFIVTNLDAPSPMLLPIGHDGAAITLDASRLSGVPHFLPDEINPQASVSLAADGQWLWQDVHGSTVLHDGDTYQVASRDWQFFNKIMMDDSANITVSSSGAPPDAHFDFVVSQNEEHVQLAITAHERKIHLPERSHHYCLLLLARKRFQDARQGFDAFSQGWIGTDRFAHMLGVNENHLSMLLHRVRHQLAKECPVAPLHCHCIEKRRGEVRFGCFRFQIRRGCEVEAVFDPAQSTVAA
jgi:hypothetical protein